MFLAELNEHRQIFADLHILENELETAVSKISELLFAGGKLLIAGNGGSAADAQHIAAEFTGRYAYDRDPIAALALTTDTSALTCIANDYDFSEVFSRQLRALGKAGDVLLVISTSGNSTNIIEMLKLCSKMQILTIGLLGKKGGKAADLLDIAITVPSDNTARIQEAHIFLGHYICGQVESRLAPRTP